MSKNLYEQNPFDYLDFINNEIARITYYIGIINNFRHSYYPGVIQPLILLTVIQCRFSLLQLEEMLKIPDSELGKNLEEGDKK